MARMAEQWKGQCFPLSVLRQHDKTETNHHVRGEHIVSAGE